MERTLTCSLGSSEPFQPVQPSTASSWKPTSFQVAPESQETCLSTQTSTLHSSEAVASVVLPPAPRMSQVTVAVFS